ncbi:MscS Mechanosensitive ion channel [Denitrovibrio acetiphilus DSM 12809]|uniref:MscS Mechanosensitive ion channel n=1 Tax=Denitrovibrio acetiphilus (strain DSM 12809 / NBRC 114555 / N2460) TaxID=522772 RepID=D4H6E1_DENA2|nr:mechanosensitive ion channel domain-containing protein [Denitrovibrio acetiphilus]ADD69615.1 MscS Mechanosensitive ion channel [Denitrovibrio acetiphilus DSM 12809]
MHIDAEAIKQFIFNTSEYSITFFAAFISYFIVKNVLIRVIISFLQRTKNTIDDLLIDSKLLNHLAFIAPAIVLLYTKEIINMPPELTQIISAYIGLNITFFLVRLFTLINSIYNTFNISTTRPIKGYLQLAQVIIGFMGVVASVYIAVGKSPLGFLSGLGAMTAILMLIFRDTILSFIAGMQIMFNDLIHKGDWIEVPRFGADGDVIDIALYNVTVQNFDKTIVYIPTSKLMDGSFKNWRGMKEAGGRRIKRAINIDQSSVRFISKDDIDRYRKFKVLKEYFDKKLQEDIDIEGTDINRRKLTNIGTFRAYIINYLRNHPHIRQDLTFLVRQLPPSPDGLPIEIYVFTDDTDWIRYEGIQSDIFDHLLAAVREFDLAVFQHPAGSDFKKLVQVPDNYSD